MSLVIHRTLLAIFSVTSALLLWLFGPGPVFAVFSIGIVAWFFLAAMLVKCWRCKAKPAAVDVWLAIGLRMKCPQCGAML